MGTRQYKPHTPEGHRGHTTAVTVKSLHLVLALEVPHQYLHQSAASQRKHTSSVGYSCSSLQGQVLGSISWLQTVACLLPFDFPDVQRLPRFAESQGNSFIDLPIMLIQSLNLLILSLFCLILRCFLLFLSL